MKEYIEREALMAYAHQQPSGFISDISIQFFPAADVVERKRGEWETTPTYVFSRDGAVLNRHTHRECGYHYRDYLTHDANNVITGGLRPDIGMLACSAATICLTPEIEESK